MVCVAFPHCFLTLLYCLRPETPGSRTEWVLAAKGLGQRPPERFFLLKGLLVFGVPLLRQSVALPDLLQSSPEENVFILENV